MAVSEKDLCDDRVILLHVQRPQLGTEEHASFPGTRQQRLAVWLAKEAHNVSFAFRVRPRPSRRSGKPRSKAVSSICHAKAKVGIDRTCRPDLESNPDLHTIHYHTSIRRP